ncbi:unknown [Anaerotruncus sp. CAG:390]|nr:unknown [Anaerotruncus sp. CAG:390]
MQHAHARTLPNGDLDRGIIYRIADISRSEICVKLARRHNGAVVLRLLGGCAEVRDVDYPLHTYGLGSGEIGDVACDFAGGERFLYVGSDCKVGACKIDDAHPVLHFCDALAVYHSAVRGDRGNVQSDVIGCGINFVK